MGKPNLSKWQTRKAAINTKGKYDVNNCGKEAIRETFNKLKELMKNAQRRRTNIMREHCKKIKVINGRRTDKKYWTNMKTYKFTEANRETRGGG